MRYLILILGDEAAELAMTGDERREVMLAHQAYAARLAEAAGAWSPARPSTRAALRPRSGFPAGGDPVVSDGPYAETKEQLGGFYVVECADRATALRYGQRRPVEPGRGGRGPAHRRDGRRGMIDLTTEKGAAVAARLPSAS